MKNIRIDYYRFRIRKGRADVLLQTTDTPGEYCIPYRYVDATEHIAWTIRHGDIEDDKNGDLVINDCTLNDCHLKKDGKEWVPLNRILDLQLQRNESFHVYHHILSFFMRLCPSEGEPGIRRSVSEILETVKVNIAKKEYVDELKRALERECWVIPDAHMTPPNPELIKKEIETMEHFRLYKPNEIAMNQKDGLLKENDGYRYEPIDWEVFGAVIKPFPMFPFRPHTSPFIDNLEED